MKHLFIYLASILAVLLLNSPVVNAQVDYIIDGEAQLDAFLAGAGLNKETVRNLTLKNMPNIAIPGGDCDTKIAEVQNRVKEITGTVIWDNLGVKCTESFFDAIICNKANIIIRNCPILKWTNGFNPKNGINSQAGAGYAHIQGDFVLENLPTLATLANGGWADGDCFSSIETIGGSLRYLNTGTADNAGPNMSLGATPHLSSIGGDFEVSDVYGFYSMGGSQLTSIGGSLILKAPKMDNLNGLENITADIGGDVIINSPGVPVYSPDAIGSCYVKYLKEDAGAIIGDITIYYEGKRVNPESINGCYDGHSTSDDSGLTYLETGIRNFANEKKISVFPTAVSNVESISIASNVDLSWIELFDWSGKSILKIAGMPAGNISLPVANLAKGVYIMRLTPADKEVEVYKIIK
jgi:hypothetical protein